MRYFCAVKGCGNKVCLTKNNCIVYHSFPTNLERLEKWIRFCGWSDEWQPQANQGICSVHFEKSCYDERFKIRTKILGAKKRRQLKMDAIPSLRGNVETVNVVNRSFSATSESDIFEWIGAQASEQEEDCSTDKSVAAMNEDYSTNEYDVYDYYQTRNDTTRLIESKTCKICHSVLLSEAKHLLQHAMMGNTYKSIIEKTLNIPVLDDDDTNMRICEKCSNFIEDLHCFVNLCREGLARNVDKPQNPKQNVFQISDEEECYDYDTVSLEEEISDQHSMGVTIKEEITIEPSEDHEFCYGQASQFDRDPLDPLDTDSSEAGPSNSNHVPKQSDICGLMIEKDLQLHKKTYFDFAVKCYICGEAYTDKSQLQVHMNSHTKEIKYPCQYCDRVFYVSRSHHDHEQTHLKKSSNVKYRCDKCDSVYSSEKQLDVHFKLKHLLIHKYACKHCDYSTNQNNRLLNHFRGKHTDKRPYQCAVCGSTTRNEANHNIHFQRHMKKGDAKEYKIKCAYCVKIFTKVAAFESHLIDRHPTEAVIV